MPRPRKITSVCPKCEGAWIDKGKLLVCEHCGETQAKEGY